MNHDPTDLAALGYTFADLELPDMPAFPTLRRIAKRLDYPVESIVCFRHAPDSWGVWVIPNAKNGFREPESILPSVSTPSTH